MRPQASPARQNAPSGARLSSRVRRGILEPGAAAARRVAKPMLTIVFDLDGTLVDTAPDLIDTLNLILAREGLPGVPFASARRMIGGGSRGMLERALAEDGRPAGKVEMDRIYAAYIEHYAAHIADRSRPFPQLE